MAEFLNMGGHGVFIWPCYAMAFFLLVALLVTSVKSLAKGKRELSVMEELTQTAKQKGQTP